MLLIASYLIDVPVFGAVADVVRGAVMVLFVISAVLVTLVVLAQEGKGGGLAGAFGGAGADTFGVKAGTVNKFTAWLAAAFLGLALLHAGLSSFTTTDDTTPDISEFEEQNPDKAGPAEEDDENATPPKDGDANDKKGSGPGEGDGQGRGAGDGSGDQNEGKKGTGPGKGDGQGPGKGDGSGDKNEGQPKDDK